ncbi:hypothetical protein JX265_012365 [Neoarthrinium moseri]|uniref:Uncharacterized protein n=1 Tax=Neoarthrinium moseri TaxID=1658444 RepID=A0A9P9WAI5_9PEZI|nr:hypothetical protein JX266_003015 [Neoarthrinium moseri]KAI1855010.1 hypothetical protein JX265_012365 [Neoarthrinium moseri]
MSYNTPSISSVTSFGAIESFSALQRVPALLTRFEPPEHCSTDWYWDTGALWSSSTAFSNDAHNTKWSTCQPYNATRATYSAGICPQKSEFKTVTQISWDGVSEPYYLGACCGSTATLRSYQSADASNLQGCFITVTQSSVVASMIQENSLTTVLTSAGPVTVIAEPLYMVWHQNDTSLHPESDANSLRAAMGMPVMSSAVTAIPTATGTADDSETSPSIPTGAIAGIAVAFALCLMAIGALAFLAFRRRWKAKEPAQNYTWAGQGPGNRQAWNSSELDGRQAPQEMPDSVIKPSSFVEMYAIPSAGSRTPITTPTTPIALRRGKDDDFGVEQKMLLQ